MARNPDFDAALEAMKETHDSKNEDYAEAGNPYSNFEGAAFLAGVSVDQVFHVMLGIKMERLRQLATGKTPNHESMDDTILDLAVYATLWNSYKRRQQRHPRLGLNLEADPERPAPNQVKLWGSSA